MLRNFPIVNTDLTLDIKPYRAGDIYLPVKQDSMMSVLMLMGDVSHTDPKIKDILFSLTCIWLTLKLSFYSSQQNNSFNLNSN